MPIEFQNGSSLPVSSKFQIEKLHVYFFKIEGEMTGALSKLYSSRSRLQVRAFRFKNETS